MSSPNPETSSFHYHCYEHPLNLLQVLGQLYNDKSLCDVTLVAEGEEFMAHRLILASGSPYFLAMFTNAHLESTQNRIVLNGIEAASLQALLKFIYSSTLEITECNIQSLLGAASLLQITPVKEACCEFLRVRLDPENCLGICSFADMHGCTALRDISWRFALEHFRDVMTTEEFLTTPFNVLQNLIHSENLNVQSEEEVLDALLYWYSHDVSLRHKSMISLLQYTKLPLIPLAVLQEKLLSHKALASDETCMVLVSQAMLFQNDDASKSIISNTNDFNPFIARKSVSQSLLVYAVGGEMHPGRSTVGTVDEYNPAKDSWRQLTSMTCARRGVGVGILNGLLYALGGSDGLQALRLVECYDPIKNSWARVADLNEDRSSVAAAVVNDILYAIGGYDGIMNCLSSIEKYNPETNTWSYVRSMNIPRSMVSVGVINNSLFVIGGYDGASDLSSCEMYTPESDKWVTIESMQSRRCMAGVGVVNGLLYAVGGCDCAQSLNTVEVYDPDKNLWSMISEMSEARSGLGVAVVGKRLYAIGGYTGSVYCSSVECLDPENNQWSLASNMQSGRRRFGCCS